MIKLKKSLRGIDMSKLTSHSLLLSKQQDLFHSVESDKHRPFTKSAGHVVFIFALVVFCYTAYSSFKYTKLPLDPSEIRLIRKDLTPVKLLPDNPGGEQFSNQDKLIYSSLEAKSQKKEINKHLLIGKELASKKAGNPPQATTQKSLETQKKQNIESKRKENIKPKPQKSERNNKVLEKQHSSGDVDSVFDVLN